MKKGHVFSTKHANISGSIQCAIKMIKKLLLFLAVLSWFCFHASLFSSKHILFFSSYFRNRLICFCLWKMVKISFALFFLGIVKFITIFIVPFSYNFRCRTSCQHLFIKFNRIDCLQYNIGQLEHFIVSTIKIVSHTLQFLLFDTNTSTQRINILNKSVHVLNVCYN